MTTLPIFHYFNSASFIEVASILFITMPIILICTWLDEAIHTLTFIPYAWHPNDKTYISKWCSKCSSCPPSTSRDMSSKRPPPSFMTCQRSTGKKEPALTWPQLLSIEDMGQLGDDFCSKISSSTPVRNRLLHMSTF